MSKDKQPEIRFPGFTEDWEQRKLSDIADKAVDNRGKTPTISEDGNHPLLEVASLGNGAPDYSKVTKYLSDETFMAELRAYIKEGDILFSTVGSIGLVSLMDTNENAAIAQNIVAFRANEKYDSKFLYAMLSTKDNQHKAQRIVMGAVQPSIKVSQLVDVDYCVTENMEEQRKLGEYFLNLDNLITLHQRKLDLLKETKKGFLQKMFPKNGAKVPEIRFPGFTEDWEERRLQEVVDRYDNLRIPITASKRVAGNTPYYGANGIQGYVEGYTHDGEFILVAEDGANDLKNYPVQYVDGKVWVNNHAHVIQAKENLADNMFLMNAIRSINIEPFLVGGGRAKLNADVLMKLEVIIPLKSEQQKIGNFFKQLDDTITLHQRKLDLLKEMKKGFLQKMFV